MEPGTSLINLGDLSKPATVLVEKVSNAVGILYEPRRIRKRAEAEADAEKIKALVSIELNEIQQRAIDRFVQQEARKQENIESITAQAANALDDTAKPEELDEDWVAHFFKHCDTVSDAEMQTFWSRLLSGEATRPGTFAKRTVDLVASMSKADAQMFTRIGQFCWGIGTTTPLVFDVQHEVYKNAGINFGVLMHLEAAGLLSYQANGYTKQGFGRYTYCIYFDRGTLIEFSKDSKNELQVGHVLFTEAGRELFPICGAERNSDFHEYVIERWYRSGLVVSSLLPEFFASAAVPA